MVNDSLSRMVRCGSQHELKWCSRPGCESFGVDPNGRYYRSCGYMSLDGAHIIAGEGMPCLCDDCISQHRRGLFTLLPGIPGVSTETQLSALPITAISISDDSEGEEGNESEENFPDEEPPHLSSLENIKKQCSIQEATICASCSRVFEAATLYMEKVS